MTHQIFAQEKNEIVQFNPDLNQFTTVRDFSISADGDEAFFTIQSPFQEISQIAFITKEEDNKWSAPQLMPFSDSYMYLEPFLSPDGKRLFFVSDRPVSDLGVVKKDFDIWYVERDKKEEFWSEPINLGMPVNSANDEFYPSVSENNNLYFTMDSSDGLGKDDIYFSRWENGAYAAPELLGENINSPGFEFNAFISRKENFLLFTKYNETGGFGSGDLYISKKGESGVWERATNLGEPINTKFMEYCPFYDEDNQILYFTSKRNEITSKNFVDFADLQDFISNSHNGLSKIYMTRFVVD
ncbi:hypothetical protein [Algoriphagus sp. NG3]|uniref:TolB family protein n=1 Tax=unclassified Algoriphagus TaxID=2641541 RepID=UPI002A8323FD|nr:hypothetical protein [Algoriphagus sp. NG3]WPR76875.1 hypothetical protein SLW71_05920 [Algoriphagus sp. NG3]